jgi:pyruvate/2-oxoglutarate dehydrogenase complex dihydrolipoamide acyltransferase (E2) component
VDLWQVEGTGSEGRITIKDVKSAAADQGKGERSAPTSDD